MQFLQFIVAFHWFTRSLANAVADVAKGVELLVSGGKF